MEFTPNDLFLLLIDRLSLTEEEQNSFFTLFVKKFLQKIKDGEFVDKGILMLDVQKEKLDLDLFGNSGAELTGTVFVKERDETISVFIDTSPKNKAPVAFLVSFSNPLGEIFEAEMQKEDWGKYRSSKE